MRAMVSTSRPPPQTHPDEAQVGPKLSSFEATTYACVLAFVYAALSIEASIVQRINCRPGKIGGDEEREKATGMLKAGTVLHCIALRTNSFSYRPRERLNEEQVKN